MLQACVAKFVRFHTQIEALNESGKTPEDVFQDALELYQAIQKKPFAFQGAWKLLRDSPKFTSLNKKKTPQLGPIKVYETSSSSNTGDSEASATSRPERSKKVKEVNFTHSFKYSALTTF